MVWYGSAFRISPRKYNANPELALRFCLENVVNTLDEKTKKVAMALAALSGSQSSLTMQFVTDLGAAEVEAATATLLRYAIIDDDLKDQFERTYSMPMFARAYLTRIEKSQPGFSDTVNRKYQQIKELYKDQRGTVRINPYRMSHYTVRSASEAIAATKLAQAFRIAQRGETDQALKIIAELRIIAPEYFEIYRTAAFIHGEAGDLAKAKQNYETSIDIDHAQPQLYFWYGGFAMRYLSDHALASQLFDEALKLDPEAVRC